MRNREKIANFKRNEIGPTEENVKQKIVVPLLELLGHRRQDLEFEYRTRSGGKIDIFIKNVPDDCKVLIDTKNYDENLTDHIDQIKDYTFDEAALLSILINGSEIRIYSPLRGIAFERSLLYSIEIKKLTDNMVWSILSDFLSEKNLQNRNVIKAIEKREQEIKEALSSEEHLRQEYNKRIEDIDGDIEIKEEEIDQLKKESEEFSKKLDTKISEIWTSLGLPLELFRFIQPPPYGGIAPYTTSQGLGGRRARKVTLQEIVDAGLVRNGQTMYFFHGKVFKDEQAEIVANQNKLKYKGDGKLYSISEIAKIIDIKVGLKRDEHGVAGPKYWVTSDEKLLNDLNERVRQQRGDRRRNVVSHGGTQ